MTTSRAVVLKFVADVAARATSFVTFPVLARTVGADGYGAYGLVTSIVTLAIPFASLGLTQAIVRFFVDRSYGEVVKALSRVGAVVLAVASAVGGLVALSAPWLARTLLNDPEAVGLFRIAALLVVLGAVESLLLEVLRSRAWLIHYSLLQLLQTLAIVAAILILLPRGYGIFHLLAALCVIKGAVVIAALVIVVRYYGPVPRESAPAVSVRRMIAFGLPVSLSGLGLVLVNVGDRTVVSHYLLADDLGRYVAVGVMAGLLTLASAPFLLPAYPRLMASTVIGGPQSVNDEIRMLHRYLTLSLVPATIGLVVLTPSALVVLGGGDFRISGWVTVLMIGGVFADQWNGLAHYILMCNDRTITLQNAWLGAGAGNIAINMLMVPRWGLLGAALTTLITFAALNVAIFIWATRHAPMMALYRWDVAARTVLAALLGGLAAIIVLHLGEGSLMAVLIAGMLFWGIYVVGLILMKELSPEDRLLLRRLLRDGGRPPETAEVLP